MTSAYPTAVSLWVNLNSVWTDISSDVISKFEGSYGIMGNDITDRVASSGSMTFSVNNATGIYSPNAINALAGWKKGILCKLVVSYDGFDTLKFYGRIKDIHIDSGDWGKRNVDVFVSDWFDIAATHPIQISTIGVNQRANEAIQTLITSMPIPPLNTNLGTGQDIFPTVFDTIQQKTTALSEINKLTISEFGYCYLMNTPLGETLVFESRLHRTGTNLSGFPNSSSNSGFLLMEDGSHLLLETGDKILLDEIVTVDFDNNMVSLDVSYGDRIINSLSITSYPRLVDASINNLFTLNQPIPLAAGQTITGVKGTFKDPTGGSARINGTGMISPVITTDYLMFSNSDGTGTNLSANLSFPNFQFTSNGFITDIHNSSATNGYVTKLNTRGYAIFIYDPVEFLSEDDTSINDYGYNNLKINQYYQSSIGASSSLGTVLLNQNKNASTKLNGISLLANQSGIMMQAFLYLNIGSLIHVKENKTGIDGYYYIQSVKFDIELGGIIKFTWGVVEAVTSGTSFWILGTSQLGIDTVLGY